MAKSIFRNKEDNKKQSIIQSLESKLLPNQDSKSSLEIITLLHDKLSEYKLFIEYSIKIDAPLSDEFIIKYKTIRELSKNITEILSASKSSDINEICRNCISIIDYINIRIKKF